MRANDLLEVTMNEIKAQGSPPTIVARDLNGDEECFHTLKKISEEDALTDLGKGQKQGKGKRKRETHNLRC